jgi:hypothetical protein
VNRSGINVEFNIDDIVVSNNSATQIEAGDQWVFIFEYLRP